MGVAGLPAYPFLDTADLEPDPMASIERTAYPRFKAALSAQELQTLYAPTEEERAFVATHARTDTQQLTLLTLLKCHQSLGYLPAFETIPAYIRQYLCQQLPLPPETAFAHREESALALSAPHSGLFGGHRLRGWGAPRGGAACHGGRLYHERPRRPDQCGDRASHSATL